MGEDRRVKLFCFGLGFSAETLAKRLAAKGWSIAGTARDIANIKRLRAEGHEVVRFSGEPDNAEVVAALAGTTHLLHSIPPGHDGDPVLRHYRDKIANLPTLQWIGYLSTVGVYGNSAGAVVDEHRRAPAQTRSVSNRQAFPKRGLPAARSNAGTPAEKPADPDRPG